MWLFEINNTRCSQLSTFYLPFCEHSHGRTTNFLFALFNAQQDFTGAFLCLVYFRITLKFLFLLSYVISPQQLCYFWLPRTRTESALRFLESFWCMVLLEFLEMEDEYAKLIWRMNPPRCFFFGSNLYY